MSLYKFRRSFGFLVPSLVSQLHNLTLPPSCVDLCRVMMFNEAEQLCVKKEVPCLNSGSGFHVLSTALRSTLDLSYHRE